MSQRIADILRSNRDAESAKRAIVLDLSALEFADCSAVRLLVKLAARAEGEGPRLALRRGPARVQRVFELTGTADTLPFEAA